MALSALKAAKALQCRYLFYVTASAISVKSALALMGSVAMGLHSFTEPYGKKKCEAKTSVATWRCNNWMTSKLYNPLKLLYIHATTIH